MNRLRRLGLETMFVVITAIIVSSAVRAHANDASKAAVIGDVEDVARSVPESASRLKVGKLKGEAKLLPPGFPGRLVPSSTKGLQLKSLQIVGTRGKKIGANSSVEFRAEFVWGQHAIAQQDWESPIETFLITYSEKTKEQNVHASQPVLRATTGQPIQVGLLSGTELPAKRDGCWVTVIIIGRDSASEPARLLANQTKYVAFVPAGEVSQEEDNRAGAIRNPKTEP